LIDKSAIDMKPTCIQPTNVIQLIEQDENSSSLTPSRIFDSPYQDPVGLQLLIQHQLKPNWDWLMTVMDSTEAQLRFGSALAASTDPSHPGHPLYIGTRSGRGSTSAVPGTSGLAAHHHHATERPTFR